MVAVPSAAERGREVRERLLAAAVELIPERGWSGVSTRTLASRAGVSASVVHYHFASLRVLLNEAVVRHMRAVLAGLETYLEPGLSPAGTVDALLASVGQYTGADPSSTLFVEAYLASTRDDELRVQIAAVLDEMRQRLGAWLEAGDVPAPTETAAVLAATIDGLLLHRPLGSAPPAENVAAVLHRLVADVSDATEGSSR